MKSNNAIFTFVALATTFQMYTHEGRPFERAPENLVNEPNNNIQAREALQAQQASEAARLATSHEIAIRRETNTLKEQHAQTVIDSSATPASTVAEINNSVGGKLTSKQKVDLATAIDEVKKSATFTTAMKAHSFNNLEMVLTKIANENGITDFTHETFFKSLKSAEKTGVATNVFNVIKLKFAKLIAPYQSDKIIATQVVDLTKPILNPNHAQGRLKDIQDMQARHENELKKLTPENSGFESFSLESNAQAAGKVASIAPTPTALEIFNVNFQGEMARISNSSEKSKAMAKKFNTTQQDLLKKTDSINATLKKPFNELTETDKNLIQDFLKNLNINNTSLIDKNYAKTKEQLLEITTFVNNNLMIATQTAALPANAKTNIAVPKTATAVAPSQGWN